MLKGYTKEIHSERCCFFFTCIEEIDIRLLIEAVHHNFPDAFELRTSWNACEIGDPVQIDVEHMPQVMSPAQLDVRLDKLYEIGANAVQHMFDHHAIELEFEFAEIRVECCHAWTVSEPMAGSG